MFYSEFLYKKCNFIPVHLEENVALHICVDMHTCMCLTESPQEEIHRKRWYNPGAKSNSLGWNWTLAASSMENS